MKITKLIVKNKKIYAIGAIVIGAFFFGSILLYQLYVQKPTYITVRIKGSPGNWWWVTPRPPDWLADAVHPGDKEYNATNKAIAEIQTVDIYDAGGPTKDVYLTAKLDVRYNAQTKKYRYKGEPLEVGGPISLSLGSTFFPGIVVDILDEKAAVKPQKTLTVQVRYKDRWPFEYEAVKPGQQIIDGNKRVIAEIIKKERTPAEREVHTAAGQILQRYSPVMDDFIITIKLAVDVREDQYVYREEQYVKVGNQLWLLFPQYNISGAQIMKIEE
jgi:hypothetical protein